MIKAWFDTHRHFLLALALPLTLAASGCMDAAEADLADDPSAEVKADEPTDSIESEVAQPCTVRSDERLYCKNKYKAPIYDDLDFLHQPTDELHTTYSWFDCWEHGALHAGGNKTWYHTQGDRDGDWGFVPASFVSTSSAFDADPKGHGLPYCSWIF